MAAWYSATVGMWPSLDAIAANSALAKNTLVFLPKRLGKLRVDVDVYFMHPALHGASKILGEVLGRWWMQDDLQRTIVHRHNRFLDDSDSS